METSQGPDRTSFLGLINTETLKLALFCLISFCFSTTPVSSLDTSRQISQYGHTAWRIEDGAFPATPNVIAQTTDGYLWIGTQAGLIRFDGVGFVSWKPPEGSELPSSRINSLLGASDGSLWIGTRMGLARWRNERLTNYTDPPGSIMAILEDPSGPIWIARGDPPDGKGPLCKVTDRSLRCYGSKEGVALPVAVALAIDSQHNLWLAQGAKVSRWQPSSSDRYISPLRNPAEVFNGVFALAARPDGSVWVGVLQTGNGGGLQQLSQGTWKPFVTPELDGSTLKVTALLIDRDGSLWVGTLDQGIYRIEGKKVDHFDRADGLSSNAINGLFQDHEGNVWIATSRGIDSFHDLRVATFSTRQGLSADQVNSVLASRDGTVWIGNYNLDVLRSGEITSIHSGKGIPGRATTSLLEDRPGRLWVGRDRELWVYERGNFRKIATPDGRPLGAVRAMAEDMDGSIWAVTQWGDGKTPQRLFRIQDFRIHEEISAPKIPPGNTLAADPHGGVWLGLERGGLLRYHKGQIELFSFDHAPELGPVHGLIVNSDSSVLAATPSGVVGWKNGKLQTLTARNGLPCDAVYSLISDSQATLWLYAACGLIGISHSELQRWWGSPDTMVKSRLLDVFDGAQPMSVVFRPNASQSPDGRLWFANENVVQMIDPAHLDGNRIPPPVHVEEVIGDRKRYAPRDGLRLPALTRDLEIDYTALSFVTPQKVRFRYKLEGRDSEWQDPGARRQAFFSNLRPGNYRFRVIASNNDGVWNEQGATLDFNLAPAYYQASWFRGLCAVAFLALLWAAYQLRVGQLRLQEKKLRDMVETIPTIVWIARPDGSNESVNRHWHEYTGLSDEKTVDSGWKEAVYPADLKRHEEKWQVSLATGEPFHNEVRCRRASDGEYRWFAVRAVPLRDRRGKIVKWYGIATDIEDRKRAEEEREKLRTDLAHVNRISMMGELAASLSHELKQPITAGIIGAHTTVEWLTRDQPNVEMARETATGIVKAGTRASEIIDRLRSLYKRIPPQRQLLDLNEIVGEMVVLLRGEANQYAVSIRTELADKLPMVTADRVQLQQVFMNLMLNSIEAMKETGGVLTIKSQLNHEGQVQISVNDTGPGLPRGKGEQIFEAFFTTKPQGSGMGLAISRSIIEAHGGRLWATVNGGRGATFHFTLASAKEDAQKLITET